MRHNLIKGTMGNPRKTYSGFIHYLNEDQIFVFGSNTQGRHGKGAALTARLRFGAIYGNPEGIQGKSFAIITKDLTKKTHPSRTTAQVISQIEKLYKYAALHPEKEFVIAYKCGDCNLNAYSSHDMAKMFASKDIPENIVFDKQFYELVKSCI